MNIITIKARVVAAPVSRGSTRLTVVTTEEAPCAGIFAATLADGHDAVTIDWGDGQVETLTAVSSLIHTYVEPGEYQVVISDDLASITLSRYTSAATFVKKCAKQLVGFKTDARELAALGTAAFAHCTNLRTLDLGDAPISALPEHGFWDCAALAGSLSFPKVSAVSTVAFDPSVRGITELHFAKANEEAITTAEPYLSDPTMGTGTAVCVFDL